MRKKMIFWIVVLNLLLAALIACWWLMTQSCEGARLSFSHSKDPIPECLLLPQQGWRVLMSGAAMTPEYGEFSRQLPEEAATSIPHMPLPRHPAMAVGGNNMHNDAYVSDVNDGPGPLGRGAIIRSRTQGFGGYGTLTFDRQGRVVAVNGNAREFQLELLDANTLDELASYDLPPRSWMFPLQGVMPWKYIGAGMYFYLDHQDRAIIPTTRNTVMVIQTPQRPADGFQLLREYDASQHVVQLPFPKLDSIAWVMPEWPAAGETETPRYWYATIEGLVGVIDANSGAISSWKIPEEIIENSFAVGEEGIFLMSDRAMYRLQWQDGAIVTNWRQGYDRGPAAKAGHITRGSGTSVTLIGSPADGLVAITDNAAPRIHLQLYRRGNGEKVCSVPLFRDHESGTDLSALAFEHADARGNPTGHFSVMVENNYGHHVFPTPDAHRGITRVDATRNGDGTFSCNTVWESDEAGIAGAKLSLASGLLYMYINDQRPAIGGYFAALDFNTGKTAYRQHTGMGHGYNAWQGVLFLHPDNGNLYTTTVFGIVMMQDSP